MEGIVKWFSNKKGWGFITGDNENEYFVHYSGIISNNEYKSLTEGSKVVFEIQETNKGPQAVNVVIEEA